MCFFRYSTKNTERVKWDIYFFYQRKRKAPTDSLYEFGIKTNTGNNNQLQLNRGGENAKYSAIRYAEHLLWVSRIVNPLLYRCLP